MYIFLFDIAHLKRFETIQLHVLSTFKIVKKTIFFSFSTLSFVQIVPAYLFCHLKVIHINRKKIAC